MIDWTHLAAFMLGGSIGAVVMALLAAHGKRERVVWGEETDD